jgi:hypothetical protein
VRPDVTGASVLQRCTGPRIVSIIVTNLPLLRIVMSSGLRLLWLPNAVAVFCMSVPSLSNKCECISL